MSDISFIPRNGNPYCDIAIENNDIVMDDMLKSAVHILLFSDARATIAELAEGTYNPTFPYDQRGWFGDALRALPLGSKLWLNRRRKATNKTIERQRDYILSALSPLKTTGVVKEIVVNAEWIRTGVMDVQIELYPPDASDPLFFEYNVAWKEI